MTSVPIKKGSGIDGLLGGHKGQKADETKPFQVEGSDHVIKAFEAELDLTKGIADPPQIHQWHEPSTYISFDGSREYKEYWLSRIRKKALEEEENVLTPAEIRAIIPATVKHERERWYQIALGTFISRSIQQSYYHGHNNFDFDLDVLDKPFLEFGIALKGRKSEPINITINGDVGYNCARWSKDAYYRLPGDTGLHFIREAERCTFYMRNDFQGMCKHIQDCTFKTPSKVALRKILNKVPRGNEVIFVHPDGKEQLWRTKDGHSPN